MITFLYEVIKFLVTFYASWTAKMWQSTISKKMELTILMFGIVQIARQIVYHLTTPVKWSRYDSVWLNLGSIFSQIGVK